MSKLEKATNNTNNLEFERYLSIDSFRGFSVFLMILYNLVPLFSENAPLILQHGKENALLFGDLVAPFFLFIMGVSLAISVNRRLAKGQNQKEIFNHAVKRSVLLFIIGIILDASVFKTIFTWGVLEVLAISYFISYLLLRYSLSIRILVIAFMYFIYSLISLNDAILQIIRTMPHGSPISFLSWAPITVAGAICGEHLILKNNEKFEKFLLFKGVFLMLLGYIISFYIPFNKRAVSVSYSIFSSGGSIFFFLMFYYLIEVIKSKHAVLILSPLRVFGINTLLTWILQYPLGYYPVYYYVGRARFLPFNQGAFITLFILIAIWAIGKALLDRDIVIKL